MTNELTEILSDYMEDAENLPPEALLDPYNPHNDQYFKDLKLNRMRINATVKHMNPKKKRCVELHMQGKSFKDIAELVNTTAGTVSKYVNSAEGLRFKALVNHLNAAIDGPNKLHRQAVLWRIGIDNEKKAPNLTISAIQEINKMAGSYAESGNPGNVVNIQINQEILPRGALDTMPVTYDSKQLEQDD